MDSWRIAALTHSTSHVTATGRSFAALTHVPPHALLLLVPPGARFRVPLRRARHSEPGLPDRASAPELPLRPHPDWPRVRPSGGPAWNGALSHRTSSPSSPDLDLPSANRFAWALE